MITRRPAGHRFGDDTFGQVAIATFLVLGVSAFISWQVLEGEDGTLTQGELEIWGRWLLRLGGAALVLAVLTWWKSRAVSLGILAGLACSAAAVVVGVLIDLLTFMS